MLELGLTSAMKYFQLGFVSIRCKLIKSFLLGGLLDQRIIESFRGAYFFPQDEGK